jgi:hypothetical protein
VTLSSTCYEAVPKPERKRVARARILWAMKGLRRRHPDRLANLAAERLHGRAVAVNVAYFLPHMDARVDELEHTALGVRRLRQ